MVLRPRPHRRGIKGALDWFLYLMSARKIRLDDVGTFAWLQLDGGQTVAQVAERLGYLVRVLRREGLLGYPGWDDSAERIETARKVSSQD